MVSRLLSKHCESDVEDNFEAKRTFHHQWYKCIYWCCHNLQVLGVSKFFKLRHIYCTYVYTCNVRVYIRNAAPGHTRSKYQTHLQNQLQQVCVLVEMAFKSSTRLHHKTCFMPAWTFQVCCSSHFVNEKAEDACLWS